MEEIIDVDNLPSRLVPEKKRINMTILEKRAFARAIDSGRFRSRKDAQDVYKKIYGKYMPRRTWRDLKVLSFS